MNSVERLIHMANQIATNFAIDGEAAAAAETANHIRLYWDPRMKRLITEHRGEGLSPIAAAAIAALANAAD
jgi:formate dehydrogenase subunit delta